MLTLHELQDAELARRATKVLSVYLDGSSPDALHRTAWRRDLDRMVEEVRHALRRATDDERDAFERCVDQLRDSLEGRPEELGTPGWVGFFTADGNPLVEELPVPMPKLVAWNDGMRIAPYLQALKQHRPVYVAIADLHRVRLYAYAERRLTRLMTLHGPMHLAGGEHGPIDPHTVTELMLQQAARRLAVLAHGDEWILVGGIPDAAIELLSLLPPRLRAHARRPAGLSGHPTTDEVCDTTAHVVTEAIRRRDIELLEAIVERQGPLGRGLLGLDRVREAMRAHAVLRIYLTGTFSRTHPAEVETLVREALATHVGIEFMCGVAASRLDELGAGVGALLKGVGVVVHPVREVPALAGIRA
jgi:hypothetical protein